MKKLFKITSLLAVVAMLLLALTGCGGSKLVGTMETDEVKSKAVAKFDKDDNLKSIEISYTFDSSDDAKEFYDEMKEDADGYKVKKSGKKVTVSAKGKDFAEQMGEDEISKDDMKSYLELMGYEIDD